ncbi:MAG: aminopeptidase N [Candidatus Wallbacteria bacterium]|nr:aminopeptidase N [Candidatus Wallbacteria bacterium]
MAEDAVTGTATTTKSKLPQALALFLACGATSFAAPPDLLTEAEARARAARVRDVSVKLSLEFQADATEYRGRASLGFQLQDTKADLRLDLRCGRIERLSVNGTPVPTSAWDGNRIMLPAAALAAGANAVEIEYATPYERTGNGLHYFKDSVDGREYLYSNFEPFTAHRLIPCFDQPDLKTVFRLTVVAPKRWRVVGNSREKETIVSGNSATHVFGPTPPLSSYLLLCVAGEYAAFVDPRADVPSRILCRQSMTRYVEAEEIFDITRRGLEFFGDYYGTPYPFEKYDQIWVPEFNVGAMENPGGVTFNERSLFRHQPTTRDRMGRAEVILHEMAHMWFGDLVTMRWWDGLWLNESFATYMSAIASVEATRFKDAFEEFLTGEKGWAYWQDQLPTTHPIDGAAPDTDSAFSSFDGITYGKGASMLKQLAFYVGSDKFRDGVRLYFKKHAWKNTELSDFIAAISEAYGQDLSDWARVHLETAGVNTIVPELGVEGGKVRSLVLRQHEGNGDKKLRSQRLNVALYRKTPEGGLQLIRALPARISGASNPVPEAVGLEAPAFVWANHGDHAYLRCFLDQASLEYARQHLEKLPDALTRRGVWMTLWEMVRDGQLGAAGYLDTFLAKAPLESDTKILQGLFRGVNQALGHYLSGPAQADYFRKVHTLAWERLERAEPGTDAQKTWFELVVDSAFEPAGLAHLEGLLDGSVSFEKLEMDPEKRWRTVQRLAAFDRPGAAGRLASELARDGTDLGKRHAIRAEASLPSAANKQAFWKRFVEDAGTSLDMLRSAMNGFHWFHQEALSKGFVDAYFQAIPKVRASRDQEFANSFVEAAFPSNVHDAALLKRAEDFLKSSGDLPSDLRKSLLNSMDELARCLRLRS